MTKVFLAFLGLIFLATPAVAYAQTPPAVEMSGKFIYDVSKEGVMTVRQEITLKNTTSLTYAPSFMFHTGGFHPINLQAHQNGGAVEVISKGEDVYEVVLPRPAVGIGAKATIVLSFQDETLSKKWGETIELRIPRVRNAKDFTTLTGIVRVPTALDSSLHIYPTETTRVPKVGAVEYTFTKDALTQNTITAFIGDIAQYKFSLLYPLTNEARGIKRVRFALPPDTAYQEVHITETGGENIAVELDSDGNWIGSVELKAQESRDVRIEGVIRLFASAREHFPLPNKDVLDLNMKPDKFWEVDDARIKEAAQSLLTARDVYEYVVKTLSYDHAKTSRPQERIGALAALSRPTEAICMEFTDLFIALMRAKGIPAREVNGFARAGDDLHPRGLGDTLHSWPEYWDQGRLMWIPVDPTWGNTTGGVDYFSRFDLNHVAFVIHGIDSTSPQTPGTYKLPDESSHSVAVDVYEGALSTEEKISFESSDRDIILRNDSPFAIYGNDLVVVAGGREVVREKIAVLPPLAQMHFPVKDTAGTVSVSFGVHTESVTISPNHVKSFGPIIVLLLLIPLGVLGTLKFTKKI